MPPELIIAGYIDRFGVEAIMGRPVLSYGEIQRMLIAENVVEAYKSMKKALNWAEWAQSNPEKARLLEESTNAHRN